MTPYLVGILFLVTSHVGKADSWTEMQGFLSDGKGGEHICSIQ